MSVWEVSFLCVPVCMARLPDSIRLSEISLTCIRGQLKKKRRVVRKVRQLHHNKHSTKLHVLVTTMSAWLTFLHNEC